MSHLIDNKTSVPFGCEQCIHFIGGCTCKAFDTIPMYIVFDAEKHNRLLEGQKGNFTFATKEERQFTNVYAVE